MRLDDRLVVDGGQLARLGLQLDFDDVRAGPVETQPDGPASIRGLNDSTSPDARLIEGRERAVGALPVSLRLHLGRLLRSDEPEARGGHHLDAGVLFSGAPVISACRGASKPRRSLSCGASWIWPSVRNRARHPARRNVRHGVVERAEKVGRLAAGLIRPRRTDPANVQIGNFRQLVLQLRLDLARTLATPASRMLELSSATTTAILERALRSSFFRLGFASAARRQARLKVRRNTPRRFARLKAQ